MDENDNTISKANSNVKKLANNKDILHFIYSTIDDVLTLELTRK